jgi:hypothetical protein
MNLAVDHSTLRRPTAGTRRRESSNAALVLSLVALVSCGNLDRSWLIFAGGYWIDEPACVESGADGSRSAGEALRSALITAHRRPGGSTGNS